MSLITEEERDELLHLCETSQSVSQTYDKIAEINTAIQELPVRIRDDIDFLDEDTESANVEEKLQDIYNFIQPIVQRD
jgi:hypothetical protein